MTYFLAERLRHLDEYLENHSNDRGVMTQDVETTGLDTRVAALVGTGISLAPGSAIYVPTGHQHGGNLPAAEVYQRLENKVRLDDLLVGYYNAKFDRNIQEHRIGYVAPRFRDVMEGPYLADCERRKIGLKLVAKEDVGFDMAKFESIFTPEERKTGHMDISTKLPHRVRDYGCADADATIRIDEHYDWVWDLHSFVVEVDTYLVDVVREMEHGGGLVLNGDYVEEQLAILRRRRDALAQIIQGKVGVPFDVNSNQQIGNVLFNRLGIRHPFEGDLAKGKSGAWTTNADVLEKLTEQGHHVAELIVCYRKLKKAVGTYFERLKWLKDNDVAPRFTLAMYRATTFRFSAPGGEPDPKEKNYDGKTGMNGQALSKGENRTVPGVDLSEKGSARLYLEELEDEEILVDLSEEFGYEEEEVNLLLGDDEFETLLREQDWVVETKREDEEGRPFTGLACLRHECAGCNVGCEPRGIDVTRRMVPDVQLNPSVRKAFMAPEGYVLASFDYAGQEIVIATNLSGEPSWIRALNSTDPFERDIHSQGALEAFKVDKESWLHLPEHVRKYRRGLAKNINFGVIFGASAYTLTRRYGIPQATAEEIWEGYRASKPTLFEWIADMQGFSRVKGYTQTYFGRRRPLRRYYEWKRGTAKERRKMAAFADRCAVNTPIQGTGADVIRIAMVRVDKRFKKEGVPRDVAKLGNQIHDELMMIVREEEVDSVVPMVRDAMQFRVKKWPVQLTVDAKVGRVWGEQQKYDFAAAA
jgi:DNA polymerase I-like protein with 3'-5' exonuclease and polymerase domains